MKIGGIVQIRILLKKSRLTQNQHSGAGEKGN
jgi:hypothetical protein